MAMVTGMEMMLKTLGIEPEKIKQTLVEAQQSIIGEVERLHSKLDALDAKLMRVELKLNTIPPQEAQIILADGAEQISQEVHEYVGKYNGSNQN